VSEVDEMGARLMLPTSNSAFSRVSSEVLTSYRKSVITQL